MNFLFSKIAFERGFGVVAVPVSARQNCLCTRRNIFDNIQSNVYLRVGKGDSQALRSAQAS